MNRLVKVALFICLILCGCGVEPEDRSFVTAIAFDEGESYRVSVLTSEGSVDSENDEKNQSIIVGTGDSIAQAVENCDSQSSGELFFGHTVLCIVDKALLMEKSAIEEMTAYMTENTRISRRVIILAGDNTDAIMSGKGNGKNVADFVSEHYKAHDYCTPVELDKLCRAIAEGGNIAFPTIKYDKKSFAIDGGVLLSEGALSQSLTKEEADSIAWLVNDGSKPIVNLTLDGKNTTLQIEDKSIKIMPDLIKIRLKLDSEDRDNGQRLLQQCRSYVQGQAQMGFNILKNNNCDIIGLKRAMEIRGVNNKPFENNIKIEVE